MKSKLILDVFIFYCCILCVASELPACSNNECANPYSKLFAFGYIISESVPLPHKLSPKNTLQGINDPFAQRDPLATKKFFISKYKTRWGDAMMDCQSRGMWLASVLNVNEQLELESAVRDQGIGMDVWISLVYNNPLRKTPSWEDYIWAGSGNELGFTYWQENSPNSNGNRRCAVSSNIDRWYFTNCDDTHYFACEYFV